MRVVFAPDSFKESLGAPEAAAALARGWLRVLPETDACLAPMADGGEGTVDALVSATGGAYRQAPACGPLGEARTARYGVLGDGRTAVIEMAAASGLALVPPARRDARVTTTRGTGDLVRHALDGGARAVLLGLGGSATNDGGAGLARALGARFLDTAGRDLPDGGAALADLARVDVAAMHPALADAAVRVACDVDNPLCGPRGASAVYGPQKGASPADVAALDAALAHYARILRERFGRDVAEVPGSGAAGGLGAGLLAFCAAVLEPGAALVAEACGLAEKLRGAGLVVTGEGRIDGQTLHGKTPMGVLAVARAAGVPAAAVAGRLGPGHEAVRAAGFTEVIEASPPDLPLAEALRRADSLLEAAGERLARWWTARR